MFGATNAPQLVQARLKENMPLMLGICGQNQSSYV
jgi:hypothetical protein